MDNIYSSGNAYGFRFNVNSRALKPYFVEYCRMANRGFFKYPIADTERVRFECITEHMLRLSEDKREAYFKEVLAGLRPLEQSNKKADVSRKAKTAGIRSNKNKPYIV